VDNASFSRRHRVKSYASARCCHPSGRAAGQAAEHVGTALPVILNVDQDVRLAAQLAVDDHPHQELERLQCLTSPADQQTGIFALYLKNE
jgi:hypothetical protein